MTTLTRWDPLREMMTLQNTMNRFFDNAWGGAWSQNSGIVTLPLDIRENEEAFIVEASVPGLTADDLDITLANNVLTIQGEFQEEPVQGQYHLRERQYGRFYRSIRLPVGVESDTVNAVYENGVLTLHLPKVAEAKPKRISVQGNGHQVLEGQTA